MHRFKKKQYQKVKELAFPAIFSHVLTIYCSIRYFLYFFKNFLPFLSLSRPNAIFLSFVDVFRL